MSKGKAALRWVAVLPVAILAVLASTLAANVFAWMLRALSGDSLGPVALLVRNVDPTTVDRLSQSIFIPLGVIWFGSSVAPAHRLKVAVVLLGALLLMGVAAFYAGLQFVDRPGRSGLVELSAALILWVVTAGYAVSLVRARRT